MRYRALVACEESQRVTIELRNRGWEAYSCDIQEPSGGHPEWHIQGDALEVLNPALIINEMNDGLPDKYEGIEFVTADNEYHYFRGQWDLLIAHPPCTFLTITGNRWFNVERYGDEARERERKREEAARFFMAFIDAQCDHIAVENPIGYMSRAYRKPDQVVQPYWFGDPMRKSTCLWLKGLPKLAPTDMVEPDVYYYVAANGRIKSDSRARSQCPKEERSRHRSKTPWGLARAIAEQWTRYIESEGGQIG